MKNKDDEYETEEAQTECGETKDEIKIGNCCLSNGLDIQMFTAEQWSDGDILILNMIGNATLIALMYYISCVGDLTYLDS